MKGYFGTSYSEECSLTHYGVKGMKWGVRRAEKRRRKYLDKTERMAEGHKSISKSYSSVAKKLSRRSDADYAEEFDDKDYLDSLGGPRKARLAEISYYEKKSKDHQQYANEWMAAYDEIANTPIEQLKKDSDYKRIVNRYLNQSI